MVTTSTSDEAQVAPSTSNPARVVVALAAAFQFLTRVPPLIRRPFTPTEMGDAVACFPIVGLALGIALAGLDWVCGVAFPPMVSTALVLAVWVLASGAMHLDGFLDTCDGLFGGATPEDRLRIMRDERVGAFAVIGGVLLMLLKFSALTSITLTFRVPALLLAPIFGRWAMSLAIVACPYAREEGLGRMMKDNAGWWHVGIATGVAIMVTVFFAGGFGLAAWFATAVVSIALVRFVLTRLPGLTGDVYGALCEVVETLILLVFTLGVAT
jgi:adenosylcobinamide-GDP ribazoletransferase